MKDITEYKALIIVTPKDYQRLALHHERIVEYLPSERVAFVGSPELKTLIENEKLNADFIDENSLIPFDDVYNYISDMMSEVLCGRELPRGICGWYYQQFLKMQFARVCPDAYYLVWDGDTIPCKAFSMFQDINHPYLDLKNEFHKPYFDTLEKLIPGQTKVVEKSFIAEHMLFKCEYMINLIDEIEKNADIKGETFWQKIINCVGLEGIQYNSFSEFETYGSFVYSRYPDTFALRTWNSLRYGGEYFHTETICERDFLWLSKDFFAISFEKGHSVREDHENLFDNPKYQEKLTARQMLELAQEDFEEGYIETWDD